MKKILCTLLFFASFVGVNLAQEVAIVPDSRPMPTSGVCAHRGDNACCPENTVPAFRSAAQKGAAMVEFDVRRCKTGELIIMHDQTVDRTTNGTGKVVELTFAEIRALDAGIKKGAEFAGTLVPTFQEAIDAIPREGIWINIHCEANVELEIAQMLKEQGRLHQAFLATSLNAITKVRKTVPEVLVCNMSRPGKHGMPWTPEQSTLYATQTVENRCDFLQLLAPCSAEDAKLLHDGGAKINYFVCNDPEKVEALLKMGADFILTDCLDLIQKKRAEILSQWATQE